MGLRFVLLLLRMFLVAWAFVVLLLSSFVFLPVVGFPAVVPVGGLGFIAASACRLPCDGRSFCFHPPLFFSLSLVFAFVALDWFPGRKGEVAGDAAFKKDVAFGPSPPPHPAVVL